MNKSAEILRTVERLGALAKHPRSRWKIIPAVIVADLAKRGIDVSAGYVSTVWHRSKTSRPKRQSKSAQIRKLLAEGKKPAEIRKLLGADDNLINTVRKQERRRVEKRRVEAVKHNR